MRSHILLPLLFAIFAAALQGALCSEDHSVNPILGSYIIPASSSIGPDLSIYINPGFYPFLAPAQHSTVTYMWNPESHDLGHYYPNVLVEFIKPGWAPISIGYAGHIPAMADFAQPSWQPQKADYGIHTPAFAAFMRDDWEPNSSSLEDFSPGLAEFLRD